MRWANVVEDEAECSMIQVIVNAKEVETIRKSVVFWECGAKSPQQFSSLRAFVAMESLPIVALTFPTTVDNCATPKAQLLSRVSSCEALKIYIDV